MPNTIQSCLSPYVLEQIGRNDLSPDALLAIEEHVSECPRCCELFDSQYTSSQWSEFIQPALSETQTAVSALTEDGVDHSSAILKVLGPTDDPSMLGRIGNFEIVGVIGQGGMGAVFKGFDRSLNRFVAIKMLLPHLAASGAARKRFAREGQAVAAVVDDHVMAIHCVDQWQGIPYLVMTYSRGISLQKRLNDSGPFEVREILRIGLQAAKGLAAAHAQGIVHRDIKPSNILLDQNVERVQLVDFGLARAVDDASLTCSGTLAGTPQYMSPEQARAEAVDHRSDLFSLGSVLYAMCAGYAPFRADSSYSVLRLIIEKEPRPIREINSDIPDWLCAIISKLMAKQAVDRFDSAKQVADLLEACLAHVQQPTNVPLPSSVAELALLGSSTSEFNQPQQALTSDPKAKTWRRFVGPLIGKYLAVAAAAAAMMVAGVVIVLELDKGTLTINSVADDVPIRIVQGKHKVQELTVSKQGTSTRLRAGHYTVEIEGDSTVYEIQGDNVTVKRGEDTLVNISISPATLVTTPPDSPVVAKPPADASKVNAASTAVDVELLLSNLDFLNSREARGFNTERSVRFGRILMELTNTGSAAVPKIIERLDSTEDDRMIASLAFVLRAIGDKRGVPALIRAIPRTLVPSQCNWIQRSHAAAGDLILFFKTHRFKGQGDAAIGCSNSETELSEALAALTGVKLPISQTFGSGTERQVYLQRQQLYKDAEQWADWWEHNSFRFVDDAAYSKVNLPIFQSLEPAAVDPRQLLDRLSWQSVKELSSLQSASSASNDQYPLAFLDLDTGRCEALPQSYRNKPLSESERADLLAWAEKDGFDLFCDRTEEADHKSRHYVLRGLGLRAWQIDDKLWNGGGFEPTSWSKMAKAGRVVTGDRLIPYVKEQDALDPAATGLFLFVTREGTPGWINLGVQVTEEPDPSGHLSADWLQDKRGFVKGRKLGLHFFKSNQQPPLKPPLKHGDAGSIHWGTPAENGLQAGVRLSPPLKSYQFGQKTLLWELPLGGKGFDGTPVIANQVIYLGDLDGRVVAVSLKDGKLKWEKKFKTSFGAPASVDGDTLYIGDQDGKLHALQISDGSAKWSFDTGSQMDAGATFFGQHLLFAAEDGNLYCLKKTDGELVWKYETGDELHCGVTLSGNRAFLGGCDGKLHIVDVTTGKSAYGPIPLGGPTSSTPTVNNGIVVVPTHGGDIFAIRAADGQQVWKFHAPELAHEFTNAVAIANGLVIASSRNRRVFALSLENGAQQWETTLRKRCDSSPLVIDGSVALVATDGRVVLLNLETGLEEWMYEVSGRCTSPALSENRLIVASDKGTIYCFGTKGIEASINANDQQTMGKAERIINGWPVPDTIAKPTFPKELRGNWRIQDAMTLTSKRPEYIDEVAVIDDNSLLLTSGEHRNKYRLSHWRHRDDNQSIELDLTAESPAGHESKTFRCLMEINGNVLTLLRQQNEHFPRPSSVEDLSSSMTRFTLVREKSGNDPLVYSPLEAIEVAKRFANDDHGSAIRVKFRVASVHPPFVPTKEDKRGHAKSELHLDFRPLPANFKEEQFLVVLTQETITQLNKLGICDIEKHFLNKEVEAKGRVLSAMYTARGMSGDHFYLIVSDSQQIVFSKERQAPVINLPNAAHASASQQTLPIKDNRRSAIESIQELCSILGIAEPRLLVIEKVPPDIQTGASEDIVGWRELVNLLNFQSSQDRDDIELKSKLAGVRRRVLDQLRTQVEFDLTQFLLDNPVWLEQGDAKHSEAAMETLRQKASEKLNELRADSQKAALDTDLQEQMDTTKSESVVTPYPMKFVSSQKAQATILNTSRLFGIFPEMPASDIRTNLLIIEKNGRERYFTCLAETLDRSSQEDAMSFDERIELWKNRLRLLEMLKVAVGAES